ncbi:Uncharacterized protein APZ42_031229 [Daphnia magna]|uniref:Uncharacterized protein n=1 Tax=Daphnia magna TaxID=35525 RepID=A0A164N0W7_9CRUS|nr:Uncharacterized protein APZ42_031229 [Daphnia magna]
MHNNLMEILLSSMTPGFRRNGQLDAIPTDGRTVTANIFTLPQLWNDEVSLLRNRTEAETKTIARMQVRKSCKSAKRKKLQVHRVTTVNIIDAELFHVNILRVKCQNGCLISANEHEWWHISSKCLQPSHVQWGTEGSFSSYGYQ